MRLQVTVTVLVFLIGAGSAIWDASYREHVRCVAYCTPVEDDCGEGCRCFAGGDVPNGTHGYCLDPDKALPEHFLNLGKGEN